MKSIRAGFNCTCLGQLAKKPFLLWIFLLFFCLGSYLTTHIAAVHEKRLVFPCDRCDKVFRWKGDVSRHKKSEHGQVKQVSQSYYLCMVSLTWSLLQLLLLSVSEHGWGSFIHSFIYSFIPQIRCSKCQACYFEKGESSKQICRAGGDDIVVQGNFPCQFCGISFQQQHVSDKHKAGWFGRVHSDGNNPVYCVQCEHIWLSVRACY